MKSFCGAAEDLHKAFSPESVVDDITFCFLRVFHCMSDPVFTSE